MASPYSKTSEYDKSNRPSAFAGLYGAVIGNFDKGPVREKTFITSSGEMDIVHGIPGVGSDIAYFIAQTFLLKSRRLWTYRIVGDGAKYGAISLGSSFHKALGTGDGTEVTFTGTAAYGRCVPGTVSIWVDGVKYGYDNPSTGALVGTRIASGTVNYFTGAVSVVFSTAIPNGAAVSVRWGFQPVQVSSGVADLDDHIFSRSLTLTLPDRVVDAVTDTIAPAPLVAPTSVLDELDATFKVYDGNTLIAYADEYGNLVDMGSYLAAPVTEITNILCGAAATLAAGRYFVLHSTVPHTMYYVWYEIDAVGTDPAVSGATGIKVAILSTDSAAQVATKTAAAIDALAVFGATTDTTGTSVVVTNNSVGHSDDAEDVNTGFVVNVVQQGLSAGEINYTTGALSINLDSGYTVASEDGLVAHYQSEVADYALISADNVGSWINDTFDLVVTKLDETYGFFEFSVYEKRTGEADLERTSYRVSNVVTTDGYGRAAFMEDRINDNDYYVRTKYNAAIDSVVETVFPTVFMSHNSFALSRLDFVGGDPGEPVTVDDYLVAAETFNNKDDVRCNILIDTTGDPTVQQKYLQVCDRDLGGRGDCYAVLYVPFDIEMSNNYIADAIDYRKYTLGSSSSFGGLYFGHALIRDTYNSRDIYVPPSGFVAAAFSYTADQYEPWFVAAGWKRGVIPVNDLYHRLSQPQRDLLYDEGINAMKYKPGRGVAIWGNKTLYPDVSSRSRANVRWLLIVVQNAIEDYNEETVFDLNDPITRNEVRVVLLNYLSGIQNRRGVYAFDVVCDDTNNTGDVIDSYRMFVDYYLQPTQGAEFINNRSVITPTGVSFEEFRL